jgi:DNA-binding MarR family transcriptional regulator
LTNHDIHEHRILTHLESRQGVTQRALSRELGIALGLTNLLVRRLVQKGWIRATRLKRNRLRYLVTAAGIAAKARLARASVRASVRFYRETCDRIRDEFADIASDTASRDGGPIPVAFYGAGALAEIAYVCLQDTAFELVALIDPTFSKSFFDRPVCRPLDLSGSTVGGRGFAKLIVMPVDDEQEVRAILEHRNVPAERVFWL